MTVTLIVEKNDLCQERSFFSDPNHETRRRRFEGRKDGETTFSVFGSMGIRSLDHRDKDHNVLAP